MPKILLVSAGSNGTLALGGMLSHWGEENGCELVTAVSSHQALQLLAQHRCAAILLDMEIPGLDPYATALAMLALPRAAATPIIFLSTQAYDEARCLKAYQCGAVDYLSAPIVPQVLLSKLARFAAMSSPRGNEEGAPQTTMTPGVDNSLPAASGPSGPVPQHALGREQFLALLGHELRNPLSAIASAVSVLEFAGVGEDKAQRARAIIRRQSQLLSRIVDDLLDLGRLMSGKVQLDRQALDLSTILDNCLETLHATGRTTAHQLHVQTAPAWITADAARIEQIITNLLDNALKYTPAGGSIDIRIENADEAVRLKVRDSGMGISPELLPHVFDPFVQGKHAPDRVQGGLGIGLALVHQLVAQHGGTISAHSTGTGLGSCFEVRFPVAIDAAVSASLNLKKQSGNLDSPHNLRTVLLIEDNADGREMMVSMLRSFGHRVLAAPDGPGGLSMAATLRPDIALIDIGLPGMDGYAVAARLRADPATAHIRLIALTGYGQQADQDRARQSGFDLHLVKPVDAPNLLEAIQLCTALLV